MMASGSKFDVVAAAAVVVVVAASLVAVGMGVTDDATHAPIPAAKEEGSSDLASPLKLEVEQLRSQILSLESRIAEKSQELHAKDQALSNLHSIIQTKSDQILTLQNDISILQNQIAAHAADSAGKADAKTLQLQHQIDALTKDLQSQKTKRHALEAQSIAAENNARDLSAKLQSLQKTSEEQKKRIQKTEQALKAAEEELMKAQLEASAKLKQLHEVHGAWLPPWLATQVARYMEVMSSEWNEHGKPAMDSFLQMATEKSKHAQKWAEPHIVKAKTKWVPAVQEKWVVLKTNTKPYTQLVSSKSVELYETAKTVTAPHITKFQEVTAPYVQKVKKISKPYIDQAANLSRPHVDRLAVLVQPYTKQAVTTYTSFLKSATTYHRQAQANIGEYLNKHEFTKQLATKELIWFMASALLALPFFFLYRIFSQIFCVKKPRKQTRGSQGTHGTRRHKRRHAEK